LRLERFAIAVISEQAKIRRRPANESKLGTFALEGLTPDEPTPALLRDYEEGALTLVQLSVAMDRRLLNARPIGLSASVMNFRPVAAL
jgi:hypothetical protein